MRETYDYFKIFLIWFYYSLQTISFSFKKRASQANESRMVLQCALNANGAISVQYASLLPSQGHIWIIT